jgi:UDP-N-acetylmuramate dehydrogenase
MHTQVPLAPYTTLGLGGPAAILAEPADEASLIAAVRAADDRDEPVFVLGGGSNVVIADAGFPGTVVRVATRGISLRAAADVTAVTVAAGENWDDVVARCVAEGLAGLECLSGIPGLAGATPIQNVGAYGQEVADTITSVRAYDREDRRITELPAAACGFGYRTSFFKQTPFAAGSATGRFAVLAVTFRLTSGPWSGRIRYPELATELGVAAGERVPLGEARAAVLKLRARKGMVLDAGDPDTRSAGSFFTNPVLSDTEFAALVAKARRAGPGPGVPHFPAGAGQVKVPAAWLIEHAGFAKGYGAPSPARVSSKHTLALVNTGNATTADLLALAREIVSGVHSAYGVTLTPEPMLIGVSL